jgi:hypothetical protein
VASPEQVERVFSSQQYLFGFFLKFLVQTELRGKQQAGRIMNFWQENHQSQTQEDTENDKNGSSQDMDMDQVSSALKLWIRVYLSWITFTDFHACNGKPWDVQKREDTQPSRCNVREFQSTKRTSSIMTLLGGNASHKNSLYSSSTQ